MNDGTDSMIIAVRPRLLPPGDDTARRNASLLCANLNDALGFDAASPHVCVCGNITGRIVLDAAAATVLLLGELRLRHLAREGFITERRSG